MPLRILDAFPHEVREIEHLWIPLADGCRLAARLWLPRDAERSPVPALVEYIPYGKREGTRDRDEPMHRYFAGHGYAALRIDLRGSGESDGVLRDEYLQQELDDGAEAIAWIARQPWCDGAVGLLGKSWGGFNALQIAALRPPALRAVVSVCSTDDRYADDAHYMGGCLLNDNLYWGAVFFQLMAQPPDPALVGARWRAMWIERLEAAHPPPERWLRHPLRDAYWRHGSVCEDYGRIACPVYAVGGWADAYSNAIPRLLAGLRAPAKGLIGPWGHQYPHQGRPGPAIGFLQESLAWWDRWLRGDAGALSGDEPAYRVWMQESVRAETAPAERPGRWVAERSWPSARVATRWLPLAPGRLGEACDDAGAPGEASDAAPRCPSGAAAPGQPSGAVAPLRIRSLQTVGRAAGSWLNAGFQDVREDDAASLCFDSAPLAERLELLGAPELRLAVASDRPTAFVVARLNDVAPDGSATRVSYGVLNLTHREGHELALPLEPGRRYAVHVRLNDVAHAFPPGHRLRLALSSACWPLVWPSPEPVTLTLWTEECRLALPVRPPHPADAALRPFGPPEAAPGPASTRLTEGDFERRVERDPKTGDVVAQLRSGFDAAGRVARSRFDAVGIEGGDALVIRTRIHPDDPLRAQVTLLQRTEAQRGDWSVAIETEIEMSCTKTAFRLAARLEATQGGARVFERRWDEQIPRLGI